MELLGAVEGALGCKRLFGGSREIRSVSQSPGKTFPEMSQAPAPPGFPEQRPGVEGSSVEGAGMHCIQAILELRGQNGQGDGVGSGNWAFL